VSFPGRRIQRLSMAVDHLFEVVAEIAIQRDGGAALLENLKRLAEQARPRRIGRKDPRYYALIRLDKDLMAIGRECQNSIEVACRLRARDTNDPHGTILARIEKLWRENAILAAFALLAHG